MVSWLGCNIGILARQQSDRPIGELNSANWRRHYSTGAGWPNHSSPQEHPIGDRMNAGPFHERYLRGEHEDVWRELIQLGARIREEPIWSDALAVTREVVRRAHANLRTIHDRLVVLGYEFQDPSNALVSASPDEDAALVEETQRQLGTFPLLVQVWYETIASVDFSQAPRQLRCKSMEPCRGPEAIFGLGSHPVLVFRRIDQAWQDWLTNKEQYFKTLAEIERLHGPSGWSREYVPYLSTGEFAGNCEAKLVRLPNLAIDAILYNEGEGDIHILDELRTAFRWGGFPYWRTSLLPPEELMKLMGTTDFYSPLEYLPDFEKLLPVLREGLLAL